LEGVEQAVKSLRVTRSWGSLIEKPPTIAPLKITFWCSQQLSRLQTDKKKTFKFNLWISRYFNVVWFRWKVILKRLEYYGEV
jgi:hypothetical protein